MSATAGSGFGFAELLNIRSNNHRPDFRQLANLPVGTLTEKLSNGFRVCGACIFVPNICSKEFYEAPSGALAGANDR
jgi:hypothetical protein